MSILGMTVVENSNIFIPYKQGTSTTTTFQFNESYLSPDKLYNVEFLQPSVCGMPSIDLVLCQFEQLLFNKKSPLRGQLKGTIHKCQTVNLTCIEFPKKFEKILERIAKIHKCYISRGILTGLDSQGNNYTFPYNHPNLIFIKSDSPTQFLTEEKYIAEVESLAAESELGVD